MKWLGVFLLPLDGMLVHRRSPPCNLFGFPNNLPIPIYTLGWREALWELSVLPKNTTQCLRPGLEPGPLDPGMSALTVRLLHLHVPLLIWTFFVRRMKYTVVMMKTKLKSGDKSCGLIMSMMLVFIVVLSGFSLTCIAWWFRAGLH